MKQEKNRGAFKLVKREVRIKRRNARNCGRWYFGRTGRHYWEIHRWQPVTAWIKTACWVPWKTFDNRTLAIQEIARLRTGVDPK